MINFRGYGYYPILRTKDAEINAYENLSPVLKDYCVPVFRLTTQKNIKDFAKKLENAKESARQRPFICDLSQPNGDDDNNKEIGKLFNPDQDFQAWREFCREREVDVPVVQVSNHGSIQQVRNQSFKIEQEFGRVAFMMGAQHIGYDVELVKNVIGALDDPANCCVFVDFQQIYAEDNLNVLRAREVMNNISGVYPDVEIVLGGSSFPNSFVEYGQHSGPVRILERQVWEGIREEFDCRYADYAAVNVEGPSGGPRPPARVDYAQSDHWRFERRSIPERGADPGPYYQEAAQALMETDSWDQEDTSWGADEIRSAAAGDLTGRKGQRRWSAVRINLHLHRQICSLNSLGSDDTEQEWEDI